MDSIAYNPMRSLSSLGSNPKPQGVSTLPPHPSMPVAKKFGNPTRIKRVQELLESSLPSFQASFCTDTALSAQVQQAHRNFSRTTWVFPFPFLDTYTHPACKLQPLESIHKREISVWHKLPQTKWHAKSVPCRITCRQQALSGVLTPLAYLQSNISWLVEVISSGETEKKRAVAGRQTLIVSTTVTDLQKQASLEVTFQHGNLRQVTFSFKNVGKEGGREGESVCLFSLLLSSFCHFFPSTNLLLKMSPAIAAVVTALADGRKD